MIPTAVSPWVLVAGGFHRQGGMDKANLAVALHLAARGIPVHLVSHSVDEDLKGMPCVSVHLVPRPLGSFALGELLLDSRGRGVARTVTSRRADARVVVNGGNCRWPDVNWVHSVHHAWPPADTQAPSWFRLKNALVKRRARRRERALIGSARIVIVNSDRTRKDVVSHLGVAPGRVRTLYLGSDPSARAATPDQKRAARRSLGVAPGNPVVAFAGALGHDRNKGFDTLWRAWRRLSALPGWDASLVAAGDGAEPWRRLVLAAGLGERVRFLGFTNRMDDVYAAADLLVSPARYEAYGLNVQEALCREVPVLVSRTAGIAERIPPGLAHMTLHDPGDAGELEAALLGWHEAKDEWRLRIRDLSAALRARTWDDMAAEFVTFVSEPEQVEAAS